MLIAILILIILTILCLVVTIIEINTNCENGLGEVLGFLLLIYFFVFPIIAAIIDKLNK